MKLTGAQILIETLCEQGVDTVFGYPGGQVLYIYDALYQAGGRIRHYLTCHEQAAAHAADGYARVTGRPGVVIATSGPGATNLVTGIATAYLDSVPLIAITGNVASSSLGRDSFQEVDILGVTMPITKHNYIVRDAEKLAQTVREAFAIATSGRPGPVLIDVPRDVQVASSAYTPQTARMPCQMPPLPDDAAFAQAAALIAQAERPFIYAGGGVISAGAAQELIAFAERLGAPLGASMMGLSAIPHDHPQFLGMTGMHGHYAATKAMHAADLIIAVGTRFSDRAVTNQTAFCEQRKVLHIDIDPAEIGKNVPAYMALIGDVKRVLTRLMQEDLPRTPEAWLNEVKALSQTPIAHTWSSDLNPKAVIEAVQKHAPKHTVIVTDVGQHQMWTAQYYRFGAPRTFVTSGGLGAMGFGMGAAMGACIGKNRAHTVLFTSDGSFHMNMNELATAVSNRLPLTIVLLNNEVLGMVRQWQTLFFEKRYAHTSPQRRTDYMRLAEAFGAKGIRVGALCELDGALKQAFSAEGPVVVEVRIHPDEKVLPMIPPGGTISQMIVKE